MHVKIFKIDTNKNSKTKHGLTLSQPLKREFCSYIQVTTTSKSMSPKTYLL